MSYDYSKLAGLAVKLLAKYGREVQIKRVSGGSTDPVTGVIVAGTTTTLKPSGMLRSYPEGLIDGTRILKSDRELIIDGSVAPLMTDKPLINGEYWSIKNIKTSSPSGTALVHFLQVCR